MFLAFVMVFVGFSWFIIGLKWRIKAWGWIPTIFCHFGNFPTFHKFGRFSLLFIAEMLEKMQDPPHHLNEILLLHISTFRKSETLKVLESPGAPQTKNDNLVQNNLQSRSF